MSKANGTSQKKPETEKKSEDKPSEKTSKKEKTPVDTSVFVGFHRSSAGGKWSFYPQVLASEESMEKKIEIFKGKCETYIVECFLPE